VTFSLFSDWHGRHLPGRDGPGGKVFDRYFDDATWFVRYVVIDVGPWSRNDPRLVEPAGMHVTAASDRNGVLAASTENARLARRSISTDRCRSRSLKSAAAAAILCLPRLGRDAVGRYADVIHELRSEAARRWVIATRSETLLRQIRRRRGATTR
jgi:hypothetical protein